MTASFQTSSDTTPCSLPVRCLAFALFVGSVVRKLDGPLIVIGALLGLSVVALMQLSPLWFGSSSSQQNTAGATEPQWGSAFENPIDINVFEAIDDTLQGFQPAGSLNENDPTALLALSDLDRPAFSFGAEHGRSDPFAPLLTKPGLGDELSEIKIDPLKALQYVGIIENRDAKNRVIDAVAILQVTDSTNGILSLVKKPGDTFMLNERLVKLKQVNKQKITVNIDGQQRTVALNEFVDHVKTQKAEADPSVATAPSGIPQDAPAAASSRSGPGLPTSSATPAAFNATSLNAPASNTLR